MTALNVDDLVDAWIRQFQYPNGRLHEYWTSRFELLCNNLGLSVANLDPEELDLWRHGNTIAAYASREFGAGIYEAPPTIAAFTRRWHQDLRAAETALHRVFVAMLRDCALALAPDIENKATDLERLVIEGLDPNEPNPSDFA